MIHKHYENVEWLEFELLAEEPIAHGCFMRHGGHSSGHLESLNLGRRVGDDLRNVDANFNKIRLALASSKNTKIDEIISARICHGADVTEILSGSTHAIPISDALMTRLTSYAIAITQADCQAAIFYDPIHHAMSNVHCGWRGNVQNVYQATVKAMQTTYQTNPADLLVCISPSLGPEHAEFLNYKQELPESFWEYQVKEHFFDLWAISEWQLKQAGVLPHHIQIAHIDTYSNGSYFSHRRASHQKAVPCGRQATVCCLGNVKKRFS